MLDATQHLTDHSPCLVTDWGLRKVVEVCHLKFDAPVANCDGQDLFYVFFGKKGGVYSPGHVFKMNETLASLSRQDEDEFRVMGLQGLRLVKRHSSSIR